MYSINQTNEGLSSNQDGKQWSQSFKRKLKYHSNIQKLDVCHLQQFLKLSCIIYIPLMRSITNVQLFIDFIMEKDVYLFLSFSKCFTHITKLRCHKFRPMHGVQGRSNEVSLWCCSNEVSLCQCCSLKSLILETVYLYIFIYIHILSVINLCCINVHVLYFSMTALTFNLDI